MVFIGLAFLYAAIRNGKRTDVSPRLSAAAS
jgi:hypothetical protein